MEVLYQIFGSKSSEDFDVCFFVEKIGTIEENKRLLKDRLDPTINTAKLVNSNLAVIKDGQVSACFKGDSDELNNALFHTYALHQQMHSQQIIRTVERNIPIKIERCLRTVISYFSRTDIRPIVKDVLRKGIHEKVQFLDQLNLKKYTDFGKNGTKIEVYKSISFQLGQTMALLNNKEVFTKEDIAHNYPQLLSYLFRQESDSTALQDFMSKGKIEILNYLNNQSI